MYTFIYTHTHICYVDSHITHKKKNLKLVSAELFSIPSHHITEQNRIYLHSTDHSLGKPKNVEYVTIEKQTICNIQTPATTRHNYIH